MSKPASRPKSAPRKDKESGADTPLLEWIFGGIGLVLFAGALTVTVLNGLGPTEPPLITTHVEPAEPVGQRFRVAFEAINSGDETASMVQLRATVRQGVTVVESQTVEIDFLPPHASRRAGVFLDRNPAGMSVDVTAVSYQHP